MSRLGNELSISRALRIFQRKRVPALCDASDSIGHCVYIHDDTSGKFFQVRRCDPHDLAKMPAFGIIIAKKSATECIVQTFGEVKGVYTGMIPNAPLYVALDATLSHDAPVPNGGEVYIQNVGEAVASTIPWFWPFSKMIRRFDTGTSNKAVKFDDIDDVFEEVYAAGPELFYRPLNGPQDGSNRVYTTDEKFLPATIRVYHNGRGLVRALLPSPEHGDFFVSESGGPGTGYDTVEILNFSPVEMSKLWANYYAQI